MKTKPASIAFRSAPQKSVQGLSIKCVSGRVTATTLIVIAAVAAALGLWLGQHFWTGRANVPMQAAMLYPQPRALPEFQLVQGDGSPLTLSDFRNHYTVAFFGFTNCADVCPTTLTAFKQAQAKLAESGKDGDVRFAFVSVDPQRDTADVIKRYVAVFNKDFIAATGTDEELTKLSHALGLVYSRGEPVNGNYAVDHSASAVIINPQAQQIGLFRPPLDADKMAADLIALQARGG
ncbi:MAG: SCO family protein [Dokdonella sp.]